MTDQPGRHEKLAFVLCRSLLKRPTWNITDGTSFGGYFPIEMETKCTGRPKGFKMADSAIKKR